MRPINSDYKYWYTSSSGKIEFQMPGECVIDCSASGSVDDAVDYWRNQLSLDLDPDLVRSVLGECGAWDEEELQDNQANMERLIWIAACDIKESIASGDYHREIALDRFDGNIYRFTGETRIDESKYGLDNYRSLDLSEVSNISWSDLEPVQGEIEHGMICIPSVLSGGDYCNSGAVEYANYLEWQDMFADSHGVDWWTMYGGLDSYGIAILVDTDNQEIINALASLKDYPVINDEAIYQVEREWEQEAWESYLAKDFLSAIDRDLDIDLDHDYTFDYESRALSDLFYALCERSGYYPEIEAHESVYIPLDRLIDRLTYSDLLPLMENGAE